jgi:WD40 repeat protein
LTYHRGRVTSVQFVSETELVSASADKTLVLWTLDDNGKTTHLNPYPYRSGDVETLGVNPATRQVLFDKGKDLQMLALPDGSILGDLQNASRSMTFTTMALFSPLGDLILTNDKTRNYVQLWRAPNPETRAYELCQLVYDKSPATCGAFDPNNKFIVTGTQSGFVLVWAMPTEQEIKRQLTAWIVNLDTAVEGDLNKVRVKAQIDNADGFLKPDAKVTMVAYPKK